MQILPCIELKVLGLVEGRTVRVDNHRITGLCTKSTFEDSRSQIFQMNVSTQEKTTLGVVPAGAVVVVLIPDGYLLCAKKFDGFGGFVEFIEDNVEQGTGENGGEYMMNGKTYKIFGEFVLATAEIGVGILREG